MRLNASDNRKGTAMTEKKTPKHVVSLYKYRQARSELAAARRFMNERLEIIRGLRQKNLTLEREMASLISDVRMATKSMDSLMKLTTDLGRAYDKIAAENKSLKLELEKQSFANKPTNPLLIPLQ